MGKDRTIRVKLQNMCMIRNPENAKVLVQDKIPNADGWGGLTFPGGHVEDGESLTASTVREVKEETGLDVRDLNFCGVIHWYDADNRERWMVYLFETDRYSGRLQETDREGTHIWMDLEEMKQGNLAPNMETYLRVFLEQHSAEAYAVWRGNEGSPLMIESV